MAKVTREFPLELLRKWDVPYKYVWSETEDVGRRWMDVCTVVFEAEDDGFFYQMSYDVGKTEYQEQGWDEGIDTYHNDDNILVVRLPRVEKHERTIVQEYWAEVED